MSVTLVLTGVDRLVKVVPQLLLVLVLVHHIWDVPL